MVYWAHFALLGLIIALFLWERIAPKMVNRLEENLLVILMMVITLVSFGQVVARYGFNAGWSAALEFTTTCFSWLILLGFSYGIKHGTHLGIDILFNAIPKGRIRKSMAMIGAFATLLYGLILLDATWLQLLGIETRSGAMDYWLKMFKIGIGTEELRWPIFIQDWFSVQDRVQRWIVLIILPISLALLSFRGLQAIWQIATNQREKIIAGHEAEELVAENKDILKED